LRGIGPAKARAIIEGRPYKTRENIKKIKGTRQGTYNKIEEQVTVK
jgi:DNA uptake protein ComE-like DNA-binding protein